MLSDLIGKVKKQFLLICVFIMVCACSIDRHIALLSSAEKETLLEFQNLDVKHVVEIAGKEEPGQPLTLALTFSEKETGEILPNQEVHFYHASLAGEYEPTDPSDETTARLNGKAETDDFGRILVKTILPGDYGSSDDNRHIHATVIGAHPEAYDIHFKQYTTAMGKRFSEGSDQHFLADLKYDSDSTLVAFLNIPVKNPQLHLAAGKTELPDCEWCGAMDAPEFLSYTSTIADENEPGERLIYSGTVYQPDGVTPAEDVLVYAYHTNAKGIYAKDGSETGNGLRHGYLRGWVKTNAQGQYQFNTILPAPYPSRNEPAHIHLTLTGEDFDEYWISSTLFEGDSLITDELKSKLDRVAGPNNIIKLTKDENGVWFGSRDIILQEIN